MKRFGTVFCTLLLMLAIPAFSQAKPEPLDPATIMIHILQVGYDTKPFNLNGWTVAFTNRTEAVVDTTATTQYRVTATNGSFTLHFISEESNNTGDIVERKILVRTSLAELAKLAPAQ